MIETSQIYNYEKNFEHAYFLLRNAIRTNSSNFLEGKPASQEIAELAFPAIVLGAFCCELLIKARLYASDADQKIKGHDLKKLFEKLNTGDQQSCMEFVTNKLQISAEKFNEQLNLHSNAFEKWRYGYEQDFSKPQSFCQGFIDNMIEALNKLRESTT